MSRKMAVLLALAGLALFVFAAGRIGWSAVFKAIAEARLAMAIIVGLSFVRLVLQTRAWAIALRSEGIETSASELIFIRLASQGVGYLSVLGPVASEPMKISLLHKRGPATAATLVDTGVYWFTSGVVGIAGCVSAVLLFVHSRRSIVPLSVVGLLFAGTLLVLACRKPLLVPLVKRLGNRCPRWLKKTTQLEIALRQFKSQYPSSIRSMFWLDIVCQALLVAEVVAVFWCLKIPFHAGTMLAVEGATRAIKIVAGWMPARIGADESGVAGAFFALGLSPVSGLTLALARRSRDLLAALIGLSWLALSAGLLKSSPTLLSNSGAAEFALAYSHEEERTCKLC